MELKNMNIMYIKNEPITQNIYIYKYNDLLRWQGIGLQCADCDSSVWPVDGEEQMADADHHVVPQWAAVTLALRLYLVHSKHQELRQI